MLDYFFGRNQPQPHEEPRLPDTLTELETILLNNTLMWKKHTTHSLMTTPLTLLYIIKILASANTTTEAIVL